MNSRATEIEKLNNILLKQYIADVVATIKLILLNELNFKNKCEQAEKNLINTLCKDNLPWITPKNLSQSKVEHLNKETQKGTTAKILLRTMKENPFKVLPQKLLKKQEIYENNNEQEALRKKNLLIEEKIFEDFRLEQKLKEEERKMTRKERPFIDKLQTYINKRWSIAERKSIRDIPDTEIIPQNFYKSYQSIFHTGFSAGAKIEAARKLKILLNYEPNERNRPNIIFTDNDIKALRNSTLGKLIKEYEYLLPKEFKNKENHKSPTIFVVGPNGINAY